MIAEAAVTTTNDQVVLALIAVIAASVGALVFVIRNGRLVKDTNTQITEVNKAVNNVGPGEHRLYDKVTHLMLDMSEIKDVLGSLSGQMEEHRLFWEDFHRKWGTSTKKVDPNNDIAVILNEIRTEVGKVQLVLKDHIKESDTEG